MSKIIKSRETVAQFWSLMHSNDFHSVGELLSDDFVSNWPVSRERIYGRANWVAIQEHYPANGRWDFTIHRMICEDNQVVCDVSVTDGVVKAQSIIFFIVHNGQISEMIEYWPELYEPPAWRAAFAERVV